MFSIFTRSSLYANLTPAERAFLRFLSTLLYGAALAGGQAVLPLLSSPTLDVTAIPWAAVAHTFLAAAALAVALGIGKYHSAQGDPPLASPAAPPAPAALAAPVAAAAPPTPDAGAAGADGGAGAPAMAFPADAAPLG